MPGSDSSVPASGLLVLRHAQSTWNAAGRWQGWANPPLSDAAAAQIEAAADVLRRQGADAFDAAYCSDLQRAHQTALALCRHLDSPEPVARRDLREHDVGEWSGLTRPEIEARWPGQIGQWSRGELAATPGGEARPAFEARIGGAVADIAQREKGRRVLVVCHGGAIRALTRVIAQEQSQVGPLSGCWVTLAAGRLRLGPAVDPLGQASSQEFSTAPAQTDAPPG